MCGRWLRQRHLLAVPGRRRHIVPSVAPPYLVLLVLGAEDMLQINSGRSHRDLLRPVPCPRPVFAHISSGGRLPVLCVDYRAVNRADGSSALRARL